MFETRSTQSLCSVCLRRLEAEYRETEPGVVELIKTCPEHGTFQTPVWRGEPPMETWRRPKNPSFPREPFTERDRGCPFDCGLCPEHGQHTCTGQIEVTQRCDLGCPVCYATSGAVAGPGAGTGVGAGEDLPLERIEFQLDRLWQASGACNVQLSGGEPTVREDLPAIVAATRRKGFAFVQVNSNGLRLGRESGYAESLAAAGLDSVYLQFDGADDEVYRSIRGRACLKEKLAAVENCVRAGLGVVLVGTVVRGVNLDKLGDLLRLAANLSVRGLHLQPAASFGRYPWELASAPRVTLPEVMRALAEQGGLSVTDFHPPGCENALCSFSAVYRRSPDGLILIEGGEQCCGPASPLARQASRSADSSADLSGDSSQPEIPTAEEGARISRVFTARHWSAPPSCGFGAEVGQTIGEERVTGQSDLEVLAQSSAQSFAVPAESAGDDFDRFLARAGLAKRFTVSCMAFQDVMTLDVDRVRGCCIHVVTPDGLLVPFCLHNLTSVDGTPLYRGRTS